jgi:hypothetical protein
MASRKRQIFFLVVGAPLIHFGVLLEMIWGCSGVKASLKIAAAVSIFISILTMRKMGRMVSESKTRAEITLVQKGLIVVLVALSVANEAAPGVVVLQYVELCAWSSCFLNLWYFFIVFYRGMSKAFRAVTITSLHNGTESLEAQGKSREVMCTLKKAKRKIVLNMVVGVLVCTNFGIIYCILLSPIVNRHEECALRAVGGTAELVVELRIGIAWISSLALHAVWIHTTNTFLVSRRNKILKKKHGKLMPLKTQVNSNIIQDASLIERSSVQGEEV